MARKGFMLLELVLVCVLVSFLAFCTSVSFRVFGELRVRMACNRLYLIFLSLQQEAVSSNKEVTLTFLKNQNAYKVKDGLIHHLQDPVMFKAPSSRALTFSHDRVVFYPSGHTDAGSVYLSNKEGACFYRISTTIAAHTYVSRAAYEDGSWAEF